METNIEMEITPDTERLDEINAELATIDLGAAEVQRYERQLTQRDYEAMEKRHADLLVQQRVAERRVAEHRERKKKLVAEHHIIAPRLAKEAEPYCFARREAFVVEVVAEAIDLDKRLSALLERIETTDKAAMAARARILAEAAEAGLPAPEIPPWVATVREIQRAIADAHRERAPSVAGESLHMRQLREAGVTRQAELAREMIEPRRT